MAIINHGRINWSASRDETGERTYQIQWLFEDQEANKGPQTILNHNTLPPIGSFWNYGGDNDPWAFCTPVTSAAPIVNKEPSQFWIVNNEFQTPNLTANRCQNAQPENPLLEPDRYRGSFVRYTQEQVYDRNGELLKTSSHERLRGPLVEFDNNRPTVTIEKNLGSLPLFAVTSLIDHVNDGPMWGVDSRCVKLTNATWTRNFYGTCFVYYTVAYEFDVDFRTFDREAIDSGTKVLACLLYTSPSPRD